MSISRRDFFKVSGGALAAGAAATAAPPDVLAVESRAEELRTQGAQEHKSICPYCSVGCGILVHTKDGKVINAEGDPEHPINEGALCSKGASLYQIVNNPTRLQKPQYRAPGAKEWKEVEWDWALEEIAKRVKTTRDKTFKTHTKVKAQEKQADGSMKEVEKQYVVNRTEGIAHVGSAALDNEECYMLQKLLRSWGLVYIEHQARI